MGILAPGSDCEIFRNSFAESRVRPKMACNWRYAVAKLRLVGALFGVFVVFSDNQFEPQLAKLLASMVGRFLATTHCK